MIPNGWLLGLAVALVATVLTAIIQRVWPAPTSDAKRLARLERRVSELSERLGIAEAPFSDVEELVLAGRKINAIKLYREQTGVSLAAAKDAVDAMEAQMKITGLV